MVPDLAVLDADPIGDAGYLARLSQFCLHFTPLAAPNQPDGLWLDITGCAHLHKHHEAGLLAELRARMFRGGYTARAAVADTPGAAHALARFGTAQEIVLPPGADLPAALAPLPVAALRLPQDMTAGLRRLGFEQIRQLMEAPRAPLVRRFGPILLQRLDQALGHAAEPIDPLPADTPIAHRLDFPEPLLTPESLAAAISKLCRVVCTQLEQASKGARRLDLLFERVDHSWQAVRAGTSRPARNPRHLARLLCEKLDTVDPGLGVESMRLLVALAEPLGWTQASAEAHGAHVVAEGGVAELIDRLAGRLGESRVFRVAPVQSRIPDRSVKRIPPLAPERGESWPARLPRPPRVLDPPQPIETVALLPDHPPAAFIWRRVRHRIRRADGPERVYGEWWKRDSENHAVRDYFAVEDEAGRRFWIYRRGDVTDPERGDLRWFLQGLW